MHKATADEIKVAGIKIIWDKQQPEMNLAIQKPCPLDLKVVPSLSYSTLIRLSSLDVPQPRLDTLPLPILRRQSQPEDELNREGYHGVRSSDMVAHQIPPIAPL